MPAGKADVAGVGGVQVHEAVRRHSVDEEAAPPARRRWRRVTIAAGRLYLAEGRKMSDGMEEFGDTMVRRKGVIWLVMLTPCNGESDSLGVWYDRESPEADLASGQAINLIDLYVSRHVQRSHHDGNESQQDVGAFQIR